MSWSPNPCFHPNPAIRLFVEDCHFHTRAKINITTGVAWEGNLCVGDTPVSDFPGLYIEDSPLGVRFANFWTAFPAGVNDHVSNSRLLSLTDMLLEDEDSGLVATSALVVMLNLVVSLASAQFCRSAGAES